MLTAVGQALLKESISLRGVHEQLLMRYVTVAEGQGTLDTAEAWLHEVGQIKRLYLASSRVWGALFEAVARGQLGESKYEVLKAIYWAWRGAGGEEEAGVTWSRWLAGAGRGGEAGRVACLWQI